MSKLTGIKAQLQRSGHRVLAEQLDEIVETEPAAAAPAGDDDARLISCALAAVKKMLTAIRTNPEQVYVFDTRDRKNNPQYCWSPSGWRSNGSGGLDGTYGHVEGGAGGLTGFQVNGDDCVIFGGTSYDRGGRVYIKAGRYGRGAGAVSFDFHHPEQPFAELSRQVHQMYAEMRTLDRSGKLMRRSSVDEAEYKARQGR